MSWKNKELLTDGKDHGRREIAEKEKEREREKEGEEEAMLLMPVKTQNLIPGPKGLPLRGNMVAFAENPLQLLVQSARQYGDVVRLRMGPRDFYLISNPEYIETILIGEQKNFHKVRPPASPRFMGNGLLRSEGEFHLRQRRLMQPAFHRQQIAEHGRVMVTYTRQMVNSWANGETRDIHTEMNRLTLLIVAQTLFGVDMAEEAEAIGAAVTEVMVWLNGRISFPLPIPSGLPTPANRRFQRAAACLDRAVYDIIRQRRASGEERNDLLAMLMAAQEEGAGMSDEQLRDEVITLLTAGHETTANTLTWTWYLLSLYPEIRQRMERELEWVLDGRPPTAADLPRLPYTQMVLQESMRLFPPAWTQARQLAGEYQFGSYRLPAGSVVLFSQYVMHRHPAYWQNAEGFDPDRFNPEHKQDRPRFAYFPFGAGVRQCIGQNFAMMEAVLILATIAQRYHLNLLPGHPVQPHPLVTLRPKYGLPVVLQEVRSAEERTS